MKHSYEQIQREVRRRTRKYRRRYEQVTLTILSMLCLILSGSMLPLLCRCRHSRLCHLMHRHRIVPVSEKAQVKAGLTVPLWPALFVLPV